jgi:hypothetical protein
VDRYYANCYFQPINFIGSTRGGRPLTNEDFSDREDEVNDFSIHSVNIINDDLVVEKDWHSFCDSVDIALNFKAKKGDTVYVVVVTYEDGDTFGRSYGNICVVDVFENEEEAEKIASIIYGDEKKSDKDDIFDKKVKRSFKGYAPWVGYFERLQSVDVFPFVISKFKKGKR